MTKARHRAVKPEAHGEDGVRIFTLRQFRREDDLLRDDYENLLEVISQKVGADLFQEGMENHMESRKVQRLWGYLIEEGVGRQTFLELLKNFEKTHIYGSKWQIADLLPKKRKADEIEEEEKLYDHHSMCAMLHKDPTLRFDCYWVDGRPLYRVRDGKKIGFPSMDTHLDNLSEKREAVKDTPPPAPAPDERYDEAVRRYSELRKENMALKIRIDELETSNTRLKDQARMKDRTVDRLRQELYEIATQSEAQDTAGGEHGSEEGTATKNAPQDDYGGKRPARNIQNTPTDAKGGK